MIICEAAKKYKTGRVFGCPYCNYSGTRENLVHHIEKNHEDMIPEGYTAARIVFNKINKKEYGTCMICGRETEWNEKRWKYNRICNREECKAKIREQYISNMNKAGVPIDPTKDPEFQQKMLANRKISGNYKFTDGGVLSYTGNYEKRRLEFMDKVLGYKSWELMSPGPTIKYTYKGEEHFWITDCYIIPSNLVIDDKDGGDNPNNRPMPDYRAKQEAKEKAIAKLGTYNYLRLTDMNFSQLLYALADIKASLLDDSKGGNMYINEDASAAIAGAFPPANANNVYIIPYTIKNSNDDMYVGMTKSSSSEMLFVDKDSKIKKKKTKEVIESCPNNIYKTKVSVEAMKRIYEAYANQEEVGRFFMYETITGKKLYDGDQFAFDPLLEEVSNMKDNLYNITEATLRSEANSFINGTDFSIPIISNTDIDKAKRLVQESVLEVKQDPRGYFLYNPLSGNRSKSYNDIDCIPRGLKNIL